MKKNIFLLVLLFLSTLTFTTNGYCVSILKSFDSPAERPHGIVWADDILWHMGGQTISGPNVLYKMDSDGNVLDTYIPSPNPVDITWDGSSLWTTDWYGRQIYNLDTTGQVIRQFATSFSPVGITFDGENLWVSDNQNDLIHQLDMNGNVLTSINSPGVNPQGLEWDGRNLWNIDMDSDLLFNFNSIGTILNTYNIEGYDPVDVAFDGTNIWISGHMNTKTIYKTDIQPVPEPSTIILLSSGLVVTFVYILSVRKKGVPLQSNKTSVFAMLIPVIFFINGCASFETVSNATRNCPKFYSGVRLDINAIANNEEYLMSMNRECNINTPKHPLVDLPFSFILDTLFTPLTIPVAFYEVVIEPIEDWLGN